MYHGLSCHSKLQKLQSHAYASNPIDHWNSINYSTWKSCAWTISKLMAEVICISFSMICMLWVIYLFITWITPHEKCYLEFFSNVVLIVSLFLSGTNMWWHYVYLIPYLVLLRFKLSWYLLVFTFTLAVDLISHQLIFFPPSFHPSLIIYLPCISTS